MKINNLTEEQEKKIVLYRNAYSNLGMKVGQLETMHVTQAEESARHLARLAKIDVSQIIWVQFPAEGKRIHDECGGGQPSTLLKASMRARAQVEIRKSVSQIVKTQLRTKLQGEITKALTGFLDRPTKKKLTVQLNNTVRSSVFDNGWLAMLMFCRDELGVEYEEAESAKLEMHKVLADCCFACWIVPGRVILCERPNDIQLKEGKVTHVSW